MAIQGLSELFYSSSFLSREQGLFVAVLVVSLGDVSFDREGRLACIVIGGSQIKFFFNVWEARTWYGCS